jgi:glycosyltransferase involved in cell wall biosynthesis
MLCERPVIATSVGSVPEVIVDRVNGLVIPGDAPSLCTAAELLHRYPAWARGLAAQGRAFAEQHGHASRMARDYQELLETLWAEKNGQNVGFSVSSSSSFLHRRSSSAG